MFGFVALAGAIALGIAAGTLIVLAIRMTFQWLQKRLTQKLAKRNVNKVAMVEMEKLAEECPNQISLSDMKKAGDYCMAEIDANGQVVGDLEFIKDENTSLDREVDALLKKERMVVVS